MFGDRAVDGARCDFAMMNFSYSMCGKDGCADIVRIK